MHKPLVPLLLDLGQGVVPAQAGTPVAPAQAGVPLFAELLAGLQPVPEAVAEELVDIPAEAEETEEEAPDAVAFAFFSMTLPAPRAPELPVEAKAAPEAVIESITPQAQAVLPRVEETRVERKPHAHVMVVEVREPVRSPQWRHEISRTVVTIVESRQPVAEIRLNPPELGPLSISVSLGGAEGKEAAIAFASPHVEVRTAIEGALPQLRDMLAGAGIELGQASVGSQDLPQQAPQASQGETITEETPIQGPRVSQGLVDTFA